MAKSDTPTLSEASGLKVKPPEAGPDVRAKAPAAVNNLEELARAVKEHRPCSGTFRLTEPYYRQGRMYQPGELVTIKDEVPGKSWEPFDPHAKAEPVVPEALPSGSAVEQDL
jgi:hypothetical protein